MFAGVFIEFDHGCGVAPQLSRLQFGVLATGVQDVLRVAQHTITASALAGEKPKQSYAEWATSATVQNLSAPGMVIPKRQTDAVEARMYAVLKLMCLC